jgi:hypothetical protein
VFFVATSKSHRRGDFYTLQAGFTKGPGQKVRRAVQAKATLTMLAQKPGNLAHSKGHRQLLAPILKNRAIQRMAGFQSSEFCMCFYFSSMN